MSLIKVIIRWFIRVAFFAICIYPFNYEIDNLMVFVLAAELITSLISLCRYSFDSLMKVIVGFDGVVFDGDDDFSYYEYQSNFGIRVIGWFFWLIAFGLKLAMLYFCYLQLFKGGITV